MNTLGLYLHIPFCKSKCQYCDFCSLARMDGETMDKYCDALMREIAAYGQELSAYTVNTVYFGGGTPTYLGADRLSALLLAVKTHFSLQANAEISAECNPATASAEGLKALKNAGFNRLSIGAQSMNDQELALLGRAHTVEDFKKTFAEAREAGFDNLSADLMFGIPSQTAESFHRTLTALVALEPEHISAYGLKIEEGTPFFEKKDALALPDEESERDMYLHAVDVLAANGYARYEISNFAKAGFESRHNLRYWEREDYLGMGLAAYSCLGNRRFSNTEDMARYLKGERVAQRETVSAHDALCEAVMLGMRLEKGIDLYALAKTYGEQAYVYGERLAPYQKGGFVRKTDKGYAFTTEGFYVSNTILSDVLDFE